MSPDMIREFIRRRLASTEKAAINYCHLLNDMGLIKEIAPMRFYIFHEWELKSEERFK